MTLSVKHLPYFSDWFQSCLDKNCQTYRCPLLCWFLKHLCFQILIITDFPTYRLLKCNYFDIFLHLCWSGPLSDNLSEEDLILKYLMMMMMNFIGSSQFKNWIKKQYTHIINHDLIVTLHNINRYLDECMTDSILRIKYQQTVSYKWPHWFKRRVRCGIGELLYLSVLAFGRLSLYPFLVLLRCQICASATSVQIQSSEGIWHTSEMAIITMSFWISWKLNITLKWAFAPWKKKKRLSLYRQNNYSPLSKQQSLKSWMALDSITGTAQQCGRHCGRSMVSPWEGKTSCLCLLRLIHQVLNNAQDEDLWE